MDPAPILRTVQVKTFGQMPGKIVFREIEEISGITLEDYLKTLDQLEDGGPHSKGDMLQDLNIEGGSGNIGA